MSAPVAYVLQRNTPADVQLARDLADAGVEVYAFASAEDLLLAAGEAPPDVLVADDQALETSSMSCAVVQTTPGCDATATAAAAVWALLLVTFRAATAPVS